MLFNDVICRTAQQRNDKSNFVTCLSTKAKLKREENCGPSEIVQIISNDPFNMGLVMQGTDFEDCVPGTYSSCST